MKEGEDVTAHFIKESKGFLLLLFFRRKVTKRIVRYQGNFFSYAPATASKNHGLETRKCAGLPFVFPTAIAG